VAAYRQWAEADHRARFTPIANERALAMEDQERYRRWVARAEDARPPAIPLRFPLVEVSAGFRVGTVARDGYGHAGPEVGLALRFDRHLGVELPVALMQTWAGSLGRWATVGTSPSFVLSTVGKGAFVYARVGPDLLIPSGASGMAPVAFVGGHVGFGAYAVAAALPGAGHVGIGFDVRGSLRGGVGGPDSAMDTPRFGIDGALVVRLAF